MERSRAGDREAFAALYERHFQGIYDFAVRIVRDQDLAADIVQDTFTRAWASLQRKKEIKNVKAWLYAVAHNAAIDEVRRSKHLVAPRADDETDALIAIPDPSRSRDPEAAVVDEELAELVWSSAAALSPQEYSLLDLHLRRGLDSDEIAESLGLRKGAVYTRLSRLKDSMEESVVSTLLMRRGRRDCLELDALLTELHAAEPTRQVRAAIKLHVEDCSACQESKRRYATPAEIFAGLAPVPALPELRGALWERVSTELDTEPPGDGGMLGAASHPVRWWLGATRLARLLLAVAAVTALGLLAVGVVFASRGGGGSVRDPDGVRSTSHALNRPSEIDVVEIVWRRQTGVAGYSVRWTHGARTLPDREADLPGDSAGARSPALAPGSWYFHLRTKGRNAGWTSTVHLGPFLIVPPAPDEPPDTALISDRPARRSTSASFAFSATKPGATFECSLDGAAFRPCASPAAYEGLGQGVHAFEVRALVESEVDPSPAAIEWVIDSRPPATSITGGPVGIVNDATARLEFSASEQGSSFRCRLDERRWERCTSPESYAGVDDGVHVFEVLAVDRAGNADSTPASRTWKVDTDPPETEIVTAPSGTVRRATATLSFSSDEAGSFECSLDGAGFALCASPKSYADLDNGRHTFAVRAVDAADNRDLTSATASWTVTGIDTRAPNTTIVSGPSGLVTTTSAAFVLASTEPGSFRCSLDGAPFRACGPRKSYSELSQGRHTFRARALDRAGNEDETPAARTWTVDSIPPDTSITSGPGGVSGDGSATFGFASSEARSSFRCSLDGGAFAPCSSPRAYSGLGEGAHTFAVRAVDAAGNADPTPAVRTWTVDASPPETTITSAPPHNTADTSATFTFTADEGGSTFQCSLDGAGVSACSSPTTYNGLSSGPHTFQVRAIDAAGNVDPTPAAWNWLIA